jgi:hypothetical protein
MAKKKILPEWLKIENFLKLQVLLPCVGAVAGGLCWWAVSTWILPKFVHPKPPTVEKIIIIKEIPSSVESLK